MIHKEFQRGTTVFVILRDGTKFVDKYVEAKSGKIILERHVCDVAQVRSITIYRFQKRKEK